MNTETPVILSAVRTPIGKFQGGLAGFSAPELGAKVVAEAIHRAGLEAKQVDEAILGNVVQAGLGQNPARQAALKGGCQPRVAAMTINKVCGSGLKAVALAAQAVQLGESEIVVAGGMESMSNCPYLLPQARTGYRLGDAKIVDSMIHDGLDRKSTRLNSSHSQISYAVFCLKKKTQTNGFGRPNPRQLDEYELTDPVGGPHVDPPVAGASQRRHLRTLTRLKLNHRPAALPSL